MPKNDDITPSMTSTLDKVFGTFENEDIAPENVINLPENEAKPPVTPEPPEPPEKIPSIKDTPVPESTLADTPPSDDTDLLPLPGDETPEHDRDVIKRYAFEAREERRRRKEAEAKLATQPPPSEVDTGEVDTLRKQIQSLENELGRLDLARSPAFQSQYDAPVKQVETRAKTLLTRAGVPEAEAEEVLAKVWQSPDLRKREVAFDTLEADVPQTVVAAIIGMSVERDAAEEAKAAALEEWKTSRAAVEERATREKQAKETREVSGLVSHAMETVRKENNPYYRTVEGNTEWNGVVSHFEDATVSVLKRNDPKEIAALVAHGLTFPRLLSQYASERDRRVMLERSVMEGSSADPESGRPTNPAPRANRAPQTGKDVINSLFAD